MKTLTEKRKARAKKTAEVFTPDFLVNQMLDKLPVEVWTKGKTFCDPACGNGNFLVHVLWRKISKGHNPLDALQSIYGVDIMQDNIRECRLRLLKIISIFEDIAEEHIKAVFKNIVYLNLKKYPTGSLEYKFEFDSRSNKRDIDRWLDMVKNGVLDTVDLPVPEESSGNTYGAGWLYNA